MQGGNNFKGKIIPLLLVMAGVVVFIVFVNYLNSQNDPINMLKSAEKAKQSDVSDKNSNEISSSDMTIETSESENNSDGLPSGSTFDVSGDANNAGVHVVTEAESGSYTSECTSISRETLDKDNQEIQSTGSTDWQDFQAIVDVYPDEKSAQEGAFNYNEEYSLTTSEYITTLSKNGVHPVMYRYSGVELKAGEAVSVLNGSVTFTKN